MNELSPQALIKDSLKLFSLPDIYFQVSEMIGDPRFSVKDIGDVISKDPALSMRLLKIVNSSVYGFQSRIDRVSRAITIVGIEELKSLVFATSVINKFNQIPSELVDMTDFWLRSVRCAVIAKHLAIESSVLHHERIFLSGLMHDIGSLVFYNKLPEQSMQVLMSANHDRSLVESFEQEIIGFTHAEVGSQLIKSWGLPESIYEAVACYLSPEQSHVHKLDSFLLCLAARLTDVEQRDGSVEQIISEFPDNALALMRLDESKVNNAMKGAGLEFMQIFEGLVPGKKFH